MSSPNLSNSNQPNMNNPILPSESLQASKFGSLELHLRIVENKLDSQLQMLKETLITLGNFKDPSLLDVKEETKTDELDDQGAILFKDIIVEIGKTVKSKFKDQHIYQFLPQVYFEQQVETIKSSLMEGLNNLKKENNVEECKNGKEFKEKCLSPKKFARGKFKLPKTSKRVLKNWYSQHMDDPYPSYEEKVMLAKEANITMKQVNNWFINMRGRTCLKSYKTQDFTWEIQKKLLVNPDPQ